MKIRITPPDDTGTRELHVLDDGGEWWPWSPNGEYWDSIYTHAQMVEGENMITLEIG